MKLNLDNINESNEIFDRDAERYFSRYRTQMKLLESSPLAKVRSITSHDYSSLGKQLENYEVTQKIIEANGSISSLGTVPRVAFDVISVSYGTSPINAIASNQPIDEELGSVYFRAVKATNTRGNIEQGDSLLAATKGGQNTPIGYASDKVTELASTSVDTTTSYSFNLQEAPVRPGTVSFTLAGDGNIVTSDNEKGLILGRGVSGTVDYVTGAVTLEFVNNPGGGNAISATYATDFERQDEIQGITSGFDYKSIRARVFVLRETVGILQTFAMQRRFGLSADDQIAEDLISAINSEIMGTFIVELNAQAVGNTEWNRRAPAGVSYTEHKQTFEDAISDAEDKLLLNAGYGTINVLLAGRSACAIMSTLPGFVPLSQGNLIGPHIFGTLNGRTVVRVPTDVLNPNTVICMYKGNNAFESAAVYAPYMPLITTEALPAVGKNPLVTQRAAAVWAGVDVLVPQFVTKISIVDQAYA